MKNFAQETVISLFDKVVPGGIGTIQPSWSAIYNQYSTIQNYLGQTMVPGGTCIRRLANRSVLGVHARLSLTLIKDMLIDVYEVLLYP